jgi:hypothetical protein
LALRVVVSFAFDGELLASPVVDLDRLAAAFVLVPDEVALLGEDFAWLPEELVFDPDEVGLVVDDRLDALFVPVDRLRAPRFLSPRSGRARLPASAALPAASATVDAILPTRLPTRFTTLPGSIVLFPQRCVTQDLAISR